MARRYDVIVIGAGLGGLSAAAHLARAGLSVRVFERHVQPGGYATTFVRRGYEHEVSLHQLSGIGRPGARGGLWRILEELGVTDRVEFLTAPDLYRTIAPGLDIRLPADREGALDTLAARFPQERRGIARFLDDVFAVAEDTAALRANGPRRPFGSLARYPKAAHATAVTLDQVLSRNVSDPRARLALAQTWGYYGLPPSRLSYLAFASGLASYLRYGAAYPRGKSQALSNALVNVIEAAGGKVSLVRGVNRVLVEGGRTIGVVDDREEFYRADYIISNADPITTCVDLIGEQSVPSGYLRRLVVARPSLSTFVVHAVCSGTPDELGIDGYELFLNPSTDLDEQYRAALSLSAPKSLCLTAYSALDPQFSTPGTTALSLTMLSDGAAWSVASPTDYQETKRRLAASCLELVERQFPGFQSRLLTTASSSPVTNMRFTGNFAGAAYGYEMTPADNPAWRLPSRAPVDGLWFVGAWTRPGGGYETCIRSGRAVAQRIVGEHLGAGADPNGGRGRRRHRPRPLIARTRDWLELARDRNAVIAAMRQRVIREQLDPGPHPTAGALRRIIDRVHPASVAARVVSVRDETPTTSTFRLAPLEGSFPPFLAGQYITVHLDVKGTRMSRAYSISSAPGTPGRLEITVRRVHGGAFANHLLDSLRPGSVVTVSGPEGQFHHDPLVDTDDLVFVAGGSGISPFRSMIDEILSRGLQRRVLLLYGSRSDEDVIFRARLERLARQHPDRFRLVLVISEPTAAWKGRRGLLSEELIREHVLEEELADKTFFLCGPAEMYQTAERALLAMGVPPHRIRIEAYGPPRDITQEKDWPSDVPGERPVQVRVVGHPDPIATTAGQPLLRALERGEVPHLSKCRGGSCGACRLRLISGDVYQHHTAVLRQTDRMAGVVLPCMTYALTDVVLQLP